jgi:hypothetical protein
MSIIKNHLQIEISIDQILYRLRLLRLNELQKNQALIQNPSLSMPNSNNDNKRCHNRPGLESRSTSQFNVRMSTIDENDEKPCKRTEKIDPITMQDTFIIKSSQSTPMIVALSDNLQIIHDSNKKQQQKELRRERNQTKRGLLMTKPEK